MLYLIRFAEIGKEPHLKKRKARKDLLKSLKSKIGGANAKRIAKGRLLLETKKDALKPLSKIHGISTFSPVKKCSLRELEKNTLSFGKEVLKTAKSFAVKLKRVGKHPFSSQELAGSLGEKLLKSLPKKKVNLMNPDEIIFIEIRGKTCYIFNRIVPGIDQSRRSKPPKISKKLPKFIVDDMLGKLAKRLRMLGYDTTYYGNTADSFLLRKSKEEKRLLVTKDLGIPRVRGANALLITKNKLEDQLKELIKKLKLKIKPGLMFSRCTICNAKVKSINKEKIKGLIPPVVYRTFKQFNYCPACKKVFWKGTHCEKLLEQFSKL